MIEWTIRRDGTTVRTLKLDSGIFQIGRAEHNDIVLDDSEVSRNHARLLIDTDGSVLIEDLGSGNGTLVHGRAIDRHALSPGEPVEITPFVLSYRAAPASPSLVIVEGRPVGHRFALTEDALSIGRGDDQDIILNDQGASRGHAILVRSDRGWALRDVGSANGMFVNGEEVRDTLLTTGDQVLIGNTLLRFEDPTEPARPAPVAEAYDEDDPPTQPDAQVAPATRTVRPGPMIAPPPPAAAHPAHTPPPTTALVPLLGLIVALFAILTIFAVVLLTRG